MLSLFVSLDQYTETVFFSSFSGTASVAAAGIFASLRITKKKLSENVFVMQGAGEVSLHF